MLYQALTAAPNNDDLAVIDSSGVIRWSELIDQAVGLQRLWSGTIPSRVGVLAQPSGATIATLAALDAVGQHVFLLDANLDPTTVDRLVTQFQLTKCINPARITLQPDASEKVLRPDLETKVSAPASCVTILTSGTEGQPKPVTHTWNSIAKPVRLGTPPQIWLLAYRAHLYAGLQVMLQCLLNHGTLVMPDPAAEPEDIVNLMIQGQVEFASATPSYWRRLLLFTNRSLLVQVPLQQITLGGEAADQPILDQLASVYPKARIVHIYATTELGRCFAVADRRAGFPVEYLTSPPRDAAELKIENGQLWARSQNRMLGYDGQTVGNKDSWMATGDLVEVGGDRVYFAGRIGDMINVGGNKVRPVAVERLLRTIEGIEDLRVYGKSSSVAGQLVACDVVIKAGYDAELVIREMNQLARGSLSAYEVPRIVQVVDVIPTSNAGKVIRRNG